MPQNTNLNSSPYFDDFSESNNYQRVLFKPGLPIQSRELTTLQSILQNQIEKFGQHMFKEGSVVIPGQVAYDNEYTSVQIDESHLGLPVSLYLDSLKGKRIKGETSGVKAKIEECLTNAQSEKGNYTLYIKYEGASENDFSGTTFLDGENLIAEEDIDYSLSSIRSGSTFATAIISNATAVGAAAKLANGVYFIRGFFVDVPDSTVILDQYSDEPSYRVGLSISEELVTASEEYNDLYDNARGFSNFAAPGADRLKISTTLIKKSLTDFNDENFIELIRIENGEIRKFSNPSPSGLVNDEMARRTYDESGDYYVTPFSVGIKETLNDRIGNDGSYYSNQTTQQGNIPSEDLVSVSIGPGKAYVRGYEIETLATSTLDIPKPRTTGKVENEALPFTVGRVIEVNNVHGSPAVGVGTAGLLNLYKSRTVTPGTASGLHIGVARLYDLRLRDGAYQNEGTTFRASLFDIQTFTYLKLNAKSSINVPAFVEGQNSGATGYVYSASEDQTQLILYQVNGEFQKLEEILVNGQQINRTISDLDDYGIQDVRQLVAAGGVAFTADTKLTNKIKFAEPGSEYTVSGESAGVSTITSPNANFSAVSGISTGDVISYSKAATSTPSYATVKAIGTNSRSIIVEATTTVNNVNVGTLPTSDITASDVNKVTLEVLNSGSSSMYSEVTEPNVASVDLNGSEIIFKKTYYITVAAGAYSATLESEAALTLEPYDSEDYNVTFDSTGTVESLTDQKLTVSGRTITLSQLSENGAATLTVTWKKRNPKAKNKVYRKSQTITIDKSDTNISGVGNTSANDGLTYSTIYGTRVQDRKISLGICDVARVQAIFESSSANNPQLPKIILVDLNATVTNALKGETIVGETSGASAVFVESNGTNEASFIYENENVFQPGETVVFQESNITANVQSFVAGDRDIKDNFEFDPGQNEDYLDFSAIVRKNSANAPTKRLTIVFDHFVIENSDPGDLVSVNSYDPNLYGNTLPYVGEISVSDIIDLRPRTVSVASTLSPFEYKSREFDPLTSSTTHVFSSGKNLNLSYEYYQGRIDKIFLTKDGIFNVSEGVPSDDPQSPNQVDNALEIATLDMPPYLYNIDDIDVQVAKHKRYQMKDIAELETRLTNVEYYTSLSLLETETSSLTIKDPTTNLDKFKSGFFVDNFRSKVGGGAVGDTQYRCSIDTAEGEARPEHYTTSIDLLLGSESIVGAATSASPDADYQFVSDLGDDNVVKKGDIVTLAYDDSEWLENKFATRSENVNPFHVVNWIGVLELNPATDTWIDTRKIPGNTVDMEGSYNAIQGMVGGTDSNTGLSPIQWGSWETTWTGKQRIKGPVVMRKKKRVKGSLRKKRRRGSFVRGRGIPITTTKRWRQKITRIREVTTIKTGVRSRQGIQYKVEESFDSKSLGERVVSSDVAAVMRSRNIEFVCKRLKPNTRLYAFFDNIDMNAFIVPKLIEIEMVSGTFAVGETVRGNGVNSTNKSIRFRLAQQNHKYGPYNSPSQTYKNNPYNVANSISSSYSSTTSILNVDTASLQIQSASGFFGCLSKGMRLVGQSSGAIARVKDIRIVTDRAGVVIGSLFIPDPTQPSAQVFNTGSKTFTLTSSATNQTISGFTDSSAETTFTSAGTINNMQETTLRIRNANVERVPRSQSRNIRRTRKRLVAKVKFRNRKKVQTRWVDPLAQSFEVPDVNGVYLTKCDIYFRTKDAADLPVTLQVRELELGLPTQTILPFGEVVLDPSEVVTSNDGSKATTFTFDSPVYCQGGSQFALVLLSASNEYTVFISRMGEEDISTINSADSEKIIVSQQPLLGSLFKSQNGATWDPSQFEDLKFNLYQAKFKSTSGTVKFYNPDLDIGNKQIVTLSNNPLNMVSKNTVIGLGKSLTTNEVNGLISGTTIGQENNPNFSAKLIRILGAVGINSDLVLTNPGSDFATGTPTYNDVPLVSVTGRGSGAKATIVVGSGAVTSATVSAGGTGYSAGDVLTVDPANTGGFGKNLTLSIPNEVGIISAFNTLVVDKVQGVPNVDASSAVVFTTGAGSTSIISGASIGFVSNISDGLTFMVKHSNHGMYSTQDMVVLSNIESDVKPEKLTAAYDSSSTDNISVTNVGIYTSFENVPVDSNNPGFLKLGDEIIKYTGVTTTSSAITGITRAIDDTTAGEYSVDDLLFKYELNGVSLRRINCQHSLGNVNQVQYPIDVDSYWLKVGISSRGVDRSTGNSNGFPELYWNETKSAGSYIAEGVNTGSGNVPRATQNIPFNLMRPNFTIMQPDGTSVSAQCRTFSGDSPDGNLGAFIDQGFQPISLEGNNEFTTPRIVASKINELTRLENYPGRKSFTIEINLSTEDEAVAPQIDLDRVSAIFTMNRLNDKVVDYATDKRVNSIDNDPNAAIYLTQVINLDKSADGLKVMFDAYRHHTNDIRVLYRAFRVDAPDGDQQFQLFPGYNNLDVSGGIIDPAKNDGLPDKFVPPSEGYDDFNPYEFNVSNIAQFSAFQIKVCMSGTNYAYVPRLKDFRVIATI